MQMIIEHILLLQRVPFFELLRTDQLRRITLILEPTTWLAGERIFDKGEPGSEMYIIVSGRVSLSLHDDPSHREFTVELRDGECFGEMGILDDLPRSASAHVLEDTEALALHKEKLDGLLLSFPELGIGMLRALSRRLRQANAALIKL